VVVATNGIIIAVGILSEVQIPMMRLSSIANGKTNLCRFLERTCISRRFLRVARRRPFARRSQNISGDLTKLGFTTCGIWLRPRDFASRCVQRVNSVEILAPISCLPATFSRGRSSRLSAGRAATSRGQPRRMMRRKCRAVTSECRDGSAPSPRLLARNRREHGRCQSPRGRGLTLPCAGQPVVAHPQNRNGPGGP